MKKHLNIFFPQWQGGGQDKATYDGAVAIKKQYLGQTTVCDVTVSLEEACSLENDIIGYKSIMTQLAECKQLILQAEPATIFTVGGGCDVALAPVSYLNSKAQGNITLLWLDAHGDLNTPESSMSKAFHGMPLRTLLGEGDPGILQQVFSTLLPSQIILLGTRDLDAAEVQYIAGRNIKLFTVNDIEANLNSVVEAVKLQGAGNIYVHIDLDVLDPQEFPWVPVPAAGGLKTATLLRLLHRLQQEYNILGVSLVEYKPSENQAAQMLADIINMGRAL